MTDLTNAARRMIELREQATPRPWIVKCQAYRNGQTGRTGVPSWIVCSDGDTTLPMDTAGDPKAQHNAPFIVAAANDGPAIAARLIAATAELAAARGKVCSLALYADMCAGLLRDAGYVGKAESLEGRIKEVVELFGIETKELTSAI